MLPAPEDELERLHTFTELVKPDGLFLVDTNILMQHPRSWTSPVRGVRAPMLVIAKWTYDEVVRLASKGSRGPKPRPDVEETRLRANAVLDRLVPKLKTGELHRGLIGSDANWILLPPLMAEIDPVNAKHFGENDAMLLAVANSLRRYDWMPPLAIVSDNRHVQLLAWGYDGLVCLRPEEAQDRKKIGDWLASVRGAPVEAVTVAALLSATVPLRLTEIDVAIQDILPVDQPDFLRQRDSETLTAIIGVNSVESSGILALRASGSGMFFGRQSAGSFVWDAISETTDKGAVATESTLDFKNADVIPAYLVDAVRDTVRTILDRRLYPPGCEAWVWFQSIFSQNRIEPDDAWDEVSKAYEFERASLADVDHALEYCRGRWPGATWPKASDFANGVLRRIYPCQIIGFRLSP